MRIIKGPLFEWDISADKANRPAVLLVKILNNGKQILYNVHEHCLLWFSGSLVTDFIPKKGRSMLFFLQISLEIKVFKEFIHKK